MNRAQNPLLVIAALGVGFALAWSVRGDQLLECRATLHAADLTQVGNEHMMEACLDQSELLEVCELGQRAADKVIDDLDRDLTIAQAQIIVLRKQCSTEQEKP